MYFLFLTLAVRTLTSGTGERISSETTASIFLSNSLDLLLGGESRILVSVFNNIVSEIGEMNQH